MGHGVLRSIDVAREFRTRGKTVVLGGYMASIMPEEAMKYCDAIVVGDAELVWSELLEDFTKGELKSRYEKRHKGPWFSTPAPRFDLILHKPIGEFSSRAGRKRMSQCLQLLLGSLPLRGERIYENPLRSWTEIWNKLENWDSGRCFYWMTISSLTEYT